MMLLIISVLAKSWFNFILSDENDFGFKVEIVIFFWL